ncbi:MAG: hypothetical protein CMQ40_00415 [Gammaproteobacteria bacterium]|mgnify:CR=1 FL=1|nr:hypothetical protein [Gammaproteobacteria bacterium]
MKQPANITNQVAHVYYELEALVDANKLRAYTNRIRIAENSMVAMELANAAFNESRQLLNDASTAIVRNKKVIIQHLAEDAGMNNQQITNLVDQAELDYLEKRSGINKSVLEINGKMAAINTEFLHLIEEIIDTNELLLTSNRTNIRETDHLASNFDEKDHTKDQNDIGTENLAKHQEIFELATENHDALEEVYDKAASNKAAFEGLRSKIEMQKEQIERLWAHIEAQQELCFDLINGE